MQVIWLGLSCLKIVTRGAVIVTDPYASPPAARPLRVTADLVTVSNPADAAHNAIEKVRGNPFVIDVPGEYERQGVIIQGILLNHLRRTPTIAFVFEAEGFRLCHLGDITRELKDEELEQLGEVDVLFLPVGGGDTLTPEQAVRLLRDVEPRLVVPIHYRHTGFTLKPPLKPVTAFLRELGEKVSPIPKLILKRSTLPAAEEGTEVRVLARGGARA
jgi:L-ascorbate metabolism protein UlaG (beta-lactamase superfamily)